MAIAEKIKEALPDLPIIVGGHGAPSYGPVLGEIGAITVADTGIGISPEQTEHIFDSFQQADGGEGDGVGPGR